MTRVVCLSADAELARLEEPGAEARFERHYATRQRFGLGGSPLLSPSGHAP